MSIPMVMFRSVRFLFTISSSGNRATASCRFSLAFSISPMRMYVSPMTIKARDAASLSEGDTYTSPPFVADHVNAVDSTDPVHVHAGDMPCGNSQPGHVEILRCVGEGNVARSIMAEALLARLGGSAFQGFSAGRNPASHINAHAQEVLNQAGCHTPGLRPKSWNEFVTFAAPTLDIVVTVESALKNGPFPIWYSNPVYVHWPFANPQTLAHGDNERQGAHRLLYIAMEQQIRKLAALDLKGLSGNALKAKLDAIVPKG